ncbi:T9SS type A sorting domain-containing protein [bacterium]|nr:T9SS type A sorting domain-containing protein [bacterium]
MAASRQGARLALLLLTALAAAAQAGQVRLVSHNLLNYPGSTGAARAPHFQTVLAAAAPDLLLVQEMLGQSGVDQFLAQVLEPLAPGAWSAAPFHDGFDTDRALFLRADCASVLAAGWLDTALRDIDWWDLRLAASGDTLRVYNLHLKASQGSSEEQRRYEECLVLRASLDALPAGRAVLVCGDFNLYTAAEPAWQLLRSPGPGQLFDPLAAEGAWHDNPAFATVHSQSTRTSDFGGGATGGLDDRFDFLLPGAALLDGLGLELEPASYLTLGNDGAHLNLSIVTGVNGAVSAEVAQALHEASDHLPLCVDLSWSESTAVAELPTAARLDVWPNPFNPTTRLRFRLPLAGPARLEIFDPQGRRVARLFAGEAPAGSLAVDWQAGSLPAGLYLAILSQDGRPVARSKLVLLR